MQPVSRERQSHVGLGYVLAGLAATFWVASLTLGWPVPPTALPLMTDPTDLDLLVRSPTGDQLAGALTILTWAVWLVWGYVLVTTTLRVVVVIGERLSEGAAWLRSFRTLSDFVTVGPIRTAVDASLAGALFLRVAVGAGAQELVVAPTAVQVQVYYPSQGPNSSALRLVDPLVVMHMPDLNEGDLVYTVQPKDSLGKIAERFYGSWTSYTQIQEANFDRTQADGRTLGMTSSVIYPGWQLVIPRSTEAVHTDADGRRWYTVRAGDCLSSISARLLGDENRYPELFALNRGAEMGAGRVLTNPDLIWPGLQLLLPDTPPLDAAPTASEADDGGPTEAATVTPSIEPVAPPVAADSQDRASHVDPVASVAPSSARDDGRPTVVPSQDVLATPTPDLARPSNTDIPREPAHGLPPAQAALLAAAAASVVAAGGLVVRRRKRAPIRTWPETDTRVENGFADVDPVEDLARRLAGTGGPELAIARLLGQAGVFDEQLSREERPTATDGVGLLLTRHGRTSTTLVLTAPVPARPHLINCMRDAAERAFGEQVDVDGKLDDNGDVLVRVTWDPRHPVAEHLLEGAGDHTPPSAWPAPCLMPTIVLRDRQHVAINWQGVSNMLVAAPAGQGAEAVVTAFVSCLASIRSPEQLALIVIARPHTLPSEIGVFPHGLCDVVNPGDPVSVQNILESVRAGIERRRGVAFTSDADLVLVVRELVDLEPDALAKPDAPRFPAFKKAA